MLVDDTLFLADKRFKELEDLELQKAGYVAKPVEQLTDGQPIIFNGCKLIKNLSEIELTKKGQIDRIQLIDNN